ncbi:iron-containing alcohol dehydrogenase [Magnetospirillum sp. UT-4]|uniref:iron-containing alcohol dehydrogenase n=1 Tax=Magnetospirillum sp. UT-4 TaxID=2681467 RepID=UPI001383083C|nr:iron-containing alcohol dehydrogenase [Magnetospirillum sp. UT-4]CAA7616399.1 alcohol dehydrogenase, NAD(P)-dependent [Magnetospirillum sp. UT-4]
MDNFVFHNPVKLLFGKGQIAALGREISSGARVLLAYGGGSIKANGVHGQVVAALRAAGHPFVEFGGIEPNPRYETLMRAVALARAEKLDFVLAVGGGSVADGCKFIAAAIPFAGEPWDILARHAKVEAAAGLGVVLTLPATGSEMNAYAVISREATREKLAFGSPLVTPKFSVLDPETTFSLPARQLGNGIVDAFVHVLEQYLTVTGASPLNDRLAEAVMTTLVEVAPRAMAVPPDYAARADLMWCATMALNGLIGQGVPQDWATHYIGHELTALTGIDHARTLAAVWPGVVAVRRQAKRAKLLQFAARVWGLSEADEETRIDQAIARTRAFFDSVGVPTGLAAYGVAADIPEIIAGRLEARGALPLGEDGGVDAAMVRRILDAA